MGGSRLKTRSLRSTLRSSTPLISWPISPTIPITPIPPLFQCYEQYSAIYGRAFVNCTNCPASSTCHAKLTHVKGDIYAIGQCEACRFAMVARAQATLGCSLQRVRVRMRRDGTAVRVNDQGEDVYPDGSPPLRPVVDVPLPYVPYSGAAVPKPPKDKGKGIAVGVPADAFPSPKAQSPRALPPSPFMRRFPSASGLLSKLRKPSFSLSFSAFFSHPLQLLLPPLAPLTPKESKAHPQHPPIRHSHAHARTAFKTMAVGTGSTPKKSASVRWNK